MPADKVLIGDQAPSEQEVVVAPAEQEAETNPQEPALLAGKFKDVADLEKSYTELSKKIGEQGNKLGKAEEDRSLLLKQLDGMQVKNQEAPKSQDKADDFEQQISAISLQVEDGELSIGEGMKKTALISAQIAQNATVKGMQEEQSKQTVAQSKKAFADANPDFFDLQESGELDAIKEQLPGFHDDISAYYALKSDTLQSSMAAAIEAAKLEGVEFGKAEMAKIAGGDQNTQKVLQGGGKSAEEIGRKKGGPVKQNDIRESGLAALQRARGG
jgi:hypothetical protein